MSHRSHRPPRRARAIAVRQQDQRPALLWLGLLSAATLATLTLLVA